MFRVSSVRLCPPCRRRGSQCFHCTDQFPVMEQKPVWRCQEPSHGSGLYQVFCKNECQADVDTWDSDTYALDLRFSIRETVCTKASGRDPFTCDFRTGPFVPTASCRSVVEVSGELIANITVRCHRSTFSSESMSSEEMMHVPIMTPDRRGSTHREDDVFAPEAFPSRGRGSSRGDWNKPSYLSPNKME
uniref:Secreted phosphoprotein 24 n=1 Tax=Ficedula albicollis TaxID=59894 RepID=A0A803V9W2_FICAL